MPDDTESSPPVSVSVALPVVMLLFNVILPAVADSIIADVTDVPEGRDDDNVPSTVSEPPVVIINLLPVTLISPVMVKSPAL